jgi:hypothetical protein
MIVHLLRPMSPIDNLRMRCGLEASRARKHHGLGCETIIREVNCPGCLQDLIVEMRVKACDVDDDAQRWLAGGEVGRSSCAIWVVMTGRELPEGYSTSIPHDPSDFRRCHQLLELFPAWRSRLHVVGKIFPAWAPFVREWETLTALYLEELPTGNAPKLWERMKALEAEGAP